MSTLIRGWIDINKIPLEEFVEVKDKDGKPTGDRRYSFIISVDERSSNLDRWPDSCGREKALFR